jgi:hypothetical protein
MLTHGFSVEQLVDLVRAGLQKPSAWSLARARSKVARVGITDARKKMKKSAACISPAFWMASSFEGLLCVSSEVMRH